MKKSALRIVTLFVICALTGSMALAKVRSKTITFGMDFMVGNTLVKKGTYKVNFDDKTNELTLVAKDKTIAAKATAHLEKRTDSQSVVAVLTQKGENQVLISLNYPGDSQSIVITG
jgi:hypothetical protein